MSDTRGQGIKIECHGRWIILLTIIIKILLCVLFIYISRLMKINILNINATLLKTLVPIKQLQNEHQRCIASKSCVVNLCLGDELSANEECRWFVYLIEGRVDLLAIDRPPVLLQSTDPRAMHPLFAECGHKTRLIAQSSCVILRFDKQLFNAFMDKEIVTIDVPETAAMREIAVDLFYAIMHDFEMGKLKLSSLPDVAKNIKQQLGALNLTKEKLANIVTADPAITARLIKMARGKRLRVADTNCDIVSAINVLGLETSKKLIYNMVDQQPFVSQSQTLNQRMHTLYEQSIDVAALSFSISKQSELLAPGHMLLAGLLSEIGTITIINYIESTGLRLENEEELEQIITQLRGAVGNMVIKHFGLSSDLLTVVNNFENWYRQDKDIIDACDIVVIAQIFRRLKDHKLNGLPDISEVPALQKLYKNVQTSDFVNNVLSQAHEETLSIVSLLKSA